MANHWNPLVDEILSRGGIKPVQDKTTGRLADEYQALRGMPGLLNKRARPADEVAQVLYDERPDISPGPYADDLLQALDDVLFDGRPEPMQEWPAFDEGAYFEYQATMPAGETMPAEITPIPPIPGIPFSQIPADLQIILGLEYASPGMKGEC
jgi:hypothetical protein